VARVDPAVWHGESDGVREEVTHPFESEYV